ncbi:MAG: AmmeMemoRadiSam system protein B [Pirellulaceae bacterium]
MGNASLSLTSREPAVAGTFYPADPQRIGQVVDTWLSAPPPPRQAWRAALVPHAGWKYSGRIAAEVFARIEFPATIIILCPKHHAGGATCAVAPWGRWLFPGGSMEVDLELSAQLASEVPGFQLDDWPHREEHAVEVQLPLIARWAPQSRLVAVTVGRADLEQIHLCAAAIAEVVRTRLDSLLFVISSDMNHFASDSDTRRLDALALQTLEARDPDRLYATCLQHQISMCGALPAVIVLSALRALNALHRAERVDYATSADVSGDRQRVVGYAGMLFD